MVILIGNKLKNNVVIEIREKKEKNFRNLKCY